MNISGFASALDGRAIDPPKPAPAPEPLTFVVHRTNGNLWAALYHGDRKIGCKDVIVFERPVENPERLAMQPSALLAELWARYQALHSLGALPERAGPPTPRSAA